MYVCIAIVMGVTGNAFSLIIQSRIEKKADWLMLHLFIFGLLNSVFSMSISCFQRMRAWLEMGSTELCRILTFLPQTTEMIASALQCMIAVDRYWKVCRYAPDNSFKIGTVRMWCLCVFICAFAISACLITFHTNDDVGHCRNVSSDIVMLTQLYYDMALATYVAMSAVLYEDLKINEIARQY
jgi:hypothetical protein